jgi:hypothetical protein
MRDSSQAAARIVTALDNLLAREALAARSASGTRLRVIQRRITPLLESLSEMAGQLRSPQIRESMMGLAEKRRKNVLLMQDALLRIRREIDSRSEALERVRRVSPAYGGRTPVASRLNACT